MAHALGYEGHASAGCEATRLSPPDEDTHVFRKAAARFCIGIRCRQTGQREGPDDYRWLVRTMGRRWLRKIRYPWGAKKVIIVSCVNCGKVIEVDHGYKLEEGGGASHVDCTDPRA